MKMTKIRKKEKDKKIAKQLTTKICQNKLTKNSPQRIDKFSKRTMTKIRHSKLTNSPKKKMTKIRQKENCIAYFSHFLTSMITISDPRATSCFEEKHSRLRRGSRTHKTIARNT